MGLIILRAVFLLVAGGISALVNHAVQSHNISQFEQTPAWVHYVIFGGIMSVDLAVVALDVFFPTRRYADPTYLYN